MAFFSISQIEQAADKVLPLYAGTSFSLTDFTNKVADILQATGDSRERVDRLVYQLLAGTPDYFVSKETVWLKSDFFRGAQWRIVPSRDEVEEGILLSGARFAPFCEPECFSDDYELTADGKEVNTRTLSMRFDRIAPAFLFLGRSGLIDHLVAESNENLDLLRSTVKVEQTEMTITAFDLADFYKQNHFTVGDAIIATVEDWAECRFSLRAEKKDETPDREAQDAWIRDFELAMLDVCETYHDELEMPDQIAHAYLKAWEAGNDLRKKPLLSFEEYANRMYEISILRDGPDWQFVSADDVDVPGWTPAPKEEKTAEPAEEEEHDAHCHCGHDHSHAHAHECAHDADDQPDQDEEHKPDIFSISSGVTDSLDGILEERNAPLNPVEIQAFAIDSVANGEETQDAFHERMRSILDIDFADDAQETTFLNFMEEVWETAAEDFNPDFDGEKAPLRERLLELTTSRIDLANSLLERCGVAEALPDAFVKEMKHFHRDVMETLALLNSDAPLTEGSTEAEQLNLRLGDLEDRWDQLMEHAEKL